MQVNIVDYILSTVSHILRSNGMARSLFYLRENGTGYLVDGAR
jgi:hypothetical protein